MASGDAPTAIGTVDEGDKRPGHVGNTVERDVRGVIKWFDGRKMYGFVARDGTDVTDEMAGIFVHSSSIVRPTPLVRITALGRMEPVLFDLVNCDKGPEAQNVRPGGADGKYTVRGMSCDVDADVAEELLGVRPRLPARIPPARVMHAALRAQQQQQEHEGGGGVTASTQTKGSGDGDGKAAARPAGNKATRMRRRRAASTSLIERVSDSLLADHTARVPRRRRKPNIHLHLLKDSASGKDDKTGGSPAADEKPRKQRVRNRRRLPRRGNKPADDDDASKCAVEPSSARPHRRPVAMAKRDKASDESDDETKKTRVSAGGDSAAGAVRELVDKVAAMAVAH